MRENSIREPIQKRSIEKKEKIIKAGFELICKQGYHNTNTVEIAKAAGVSTGIVYQYFKDKHDIFIIGLERYADEIFFPMLTVSKSNFDKFDIEQILETMINRFIENHKLSQKAHEEIMAMTHSDKAVADFFHERELYMTDSIVNLLLQNGINSKNLEEKVHISIHLIDDLCHEIVYHKHEQLNYNIMIDLVIKTVVNLFK